MLYINNHFLSYLKLHTVIKLKKITIPPIEDWISHSREQDAICFCRDGQKIALMKAVAR